jgi:sterol desaturase/sphingolipid hydroxylase (fatty acid hydroxylase superfamily)
MLRLKNLTLYLAYPSVIVLSFVIHIILEGLGFSILVSTYTPVLLAALIMCSLEFFIPYRKNWNAESEDVKNDLLYMGLVQVMLPKFLSFFFAITLIAYLQPTNLQIWPNHLPHYIQAILVLLGADFLRYWLHVASHKCNILWKLHSVHHSPSKLYWINVARFHPVEKILQFLLEVLPFIVLGVGQEVLSLYFIFYAVNGFFQHSNIALRLGFLNYIVSGPELHRWHHSVVIRESNQNYGNNLIIWDLLFGTWFLPENKEVDELGLEDKTYPSDFLNQIKAPFIKK